MEFSTPRPSSDERVSMPLSFLHAIDQIFLSVDTLGRIAFWNREAENVFGWPEAEVLGKNLGEVLSSPHLAQNLVDQALAPLPKKHWAGDFTVVCQDGFSLAADFGFWAMDQDETVLVGITGPSAHQLENRPLKEAHRLLAVAGELLHDTPDYEGPLKTLVHLVVPQVADWCAVHLLNADGTVEQVALAPHDLSKVPAANDWLRTALPSDEIDGLPAVFRTGRPKLVTIGSSSSMAAGTIHSYLIVPLKTQPETIGAVTFVTAESGRRLNRNNLAVAEQLASHIALSIEKARLFRKSQELNVELEQRVDARTADLRAAVSQLNDSEATRQALFRFSNSLNSTLDAERILEELAKEAIRVTDADSGFAGLRVPEGMTSHQYFIHGVNMPFVHLWGSGEGVPGWVLEHKAPFVTQDAAFNPQVEHDLAVYAGVQSAICTPIIDSQDTVVGYFAVNSNQKTAGFTLEDQTRLRALVPVASIAIQNAQAFQQRVSDVVELQEASQQLQALAAKLESAREEERMRIARDLHDELGQALTAMKFDLAWLSGRLDTRDQILAQRAKAVTEQMDLMIKAVRRISTELRPGMLDDLGLTPSIEWLARDFEKHKGIPCSVTVVGSLPAGEHVPSSVALAVYRVFQEVLTNIVRHSGAKTVDVGLALADHRFVLRVHDDGRGISQREIHGRKTLGLLGMKERVQRLGGAIAFVGSPEDGTTVTVTFQWDMPLA